MMRAHRRLLLASPILLLAALAPAAGVRAEALDLARASCADFTSMSEADRSQFSLWLAGYFAGSAMRPLLDLEKITAAPAALAELCAKSPQVALVGAETRAVFIPAPAP